MAYSIRYTPTDADLTAIVEAKQPLGIRGQLIAAVAFLILAPLLQSLVMTGLSGPFGSEFVILYAVNFLVMATVLGLAFALRKRFIYPYLAKHYGYRKGETVAVDLDENGVRWSREGRSVQIAWQNISGGRDDGERLFMFAGSQEIVMVPRSAVGSDAEYLAIARYAEEQASA